MSGWIWLGVGWVVLSVVVSPILGKMLKRAREAQFGRDDDRT